MSSPGPDGVRGVSDPVADVLLHRGHTHVTTVTVNDRLEVTDAQIGSMFVTRETAKTVLGPLPDRSPTLVVDGEIVDERWETAKLRVSLARLSRWQRTKLLWAPTLRRVNVRLRRDGDVVRLRVRRRWPR